jgi:hypothetical protein
MNFWNEITSTSSRQLFLYAVEEHQQYARIAAFALSIL